jgi:hypothetical protein
MIPIQPLALRVDGGLDEPGQRALTRYYRDAGAGGLAVGCSTGCCAFTVDAWAAASTRVTTKDRR